MTTFSEINTHKPKRHWRLWGVVVCLAVAFVWRIMSDVDSRRPPFSDKDKVIASVPWLGSHGPLSPLNVNKEHYAWLDNDTLIYSAPMEQQANTLRMPKYKVMRQRVRSEQPSPAEFLPSIKPLNFSLLSSVSPNRKWLLLVDDIGVKSRHSYLVYALDGSGLKQQYDTKLVSPFWLPDAQSFGGLVVKGKIAQHRVSKHERKLVTFPQRLNGSVVFTSQGECFTSEAQPTVPPTMRLEHGSIFGGTPQMHTLPIHGVAVGATLYSVSPQGDRLLWCYAWRGNTTRLAELTQRIRWGGPIPINNETWYVTDTNGNNPQTLTTVRTEGFAMPDVPLTILFPQWLPDGKHLSVVYKGALYVVPVP